jgi:hypothetical protein
MDLNAKSPVKQSTGGSQSIVSENQLTATTNNDGTNGQDGNASAFSPTGGVESSATNAVVSNGA